MESIAGIKRMDSIRLVLDRGTALARSMSRPYFLPIWRVSERDEANLVNSLAWAELRLIISSLFFAFDFELVDKEIDWMAMQEVFTLWKKPGLIVRLKAVSE